MRVKDHPLYQTWNQMKQRCSNPKRPKYPLYGGRGISVCERWKTSLWNFVEDMGNRPEGFSLDRENTNGNYEPGNCRWVSLETQNNNKREAKLYSNNSSGEKNIHFRKDRDYFEVFGWKEGRRFRIGTADTLEAAVELRGEYT